VASSNRARVKGDLRKRGKPRPCEVHFERGVTVERGSRFTDGALKSNENETLLQVRRSRLRGKKKRYSLLCQERAAPRGRSLKKKTLRRRRKKPSLGRSAHLFSKYARRKEDVRTSLKKRKTKGSEKGKLFYMGRGSVRLTLKSTEDEALGSGGGAAH